MKVGLGQAYEGKQLFGPDMREDPYPVYQQLRTNDPIHWDESLKAWVITRYDDVAWALQDPRLSSDRVSLARQRLPGETLTPLFDLLAKLMLQLDEPDHTRIDLWLWPPFLCRLTTGSTRSSSCVHHITWGHDNTRISSH